MNRKVKVFLVSLMVFASQLAGLYPWLAMEPTWWRIPSAILLLPLALLGSWTLWTGDFTPLKWIAKKMGLTGSNAN